MEELKKDFPEGVDYEIGYDTTPFIRESISEVFKTLRDAVILVAIVVLLFLQNWRSAIIPLIAVPVAIVGTFAVMAAIGLQPEQPDAVRPGAGDRHRGRRRHRRRRGGRASHRARPGAARRDRSRRWSEVSGPGHRRRPGADARCSCRARSSRGITGQFFRQFALTIAVSTIISTFNSLTLSPALAALLLRPRDEGTATPPLPWLRSPCRAAPTIPAPAALSRPSLHCSLSPLPVSSAGSSSRLLNRLLALVLPAVQRRLRPRDRRLHAARRRAAARSASLVLLVYGGLLGLTYWQLHRARPTGFIPSQDKGYLLVNVQLPDSASHGADQGGDGPDRARSRTQTPGVKHTSADRRAVVRCSTPTARTSARCSSSSTSSTSGATPELYGDAIVDKLRKRVRRARSPRRTSTVFGPPPVRGVGRAGGFKLMIEDRGDLGPARRCRSRPTT